jgi:hypothetical protein
MDLRPQIDRMRNETARLYREWVAPRPILAGGMAASLIGVFAGFYLAPGLVWEPTPQKPAVIRPAPPPAPIVPMVNEQGRTPDYVIGADNLKRAPNPDEVVRVIGPPPPDPEAIEDALERSGERHWWAPWSWDRPDEDDIRARQAERLEDAREAAREARLAARERAQRRDERRMQREWDDEETERPSGGFRR